MDGRIKDLITELRTLCEKCKCRSFCNPLERCICEVYPEECRWLIDDVCTCEWQEVMRDDYPSERYCEKCTWRNKTHERIPAKEE